MFGLPTEQQIHSGLATALQHRFTFSQEDCLKISENLLTKKTLTIQISSSNNLIFYHFPPYPQPLIRFNQSLTDQILEHCSNQTLRASYSPYSKNPPIPRDLYCSAPDTSAETSAPGLTYDKADIERILESVRENRSFALDSLQDVKASLDQVRRAYQQNQAHFNKLVTDLRNACNNPGLQKLADLYQKMDLQQSPSPEILAYKAELYNSLAVFGMQEFYPTRGESYDSTRHERVDNSLQGAFIESIVCAGWRLDENICARALVRTTDLITASLGGSK